MNNQTVKITMESITPKLINFVSDAIGVTDEIKLQLIESFDGIFERNYATYAICFYVYRRFVENKVLATGDINFLETIEVLKNSTPAERNEFLAYCVLENTGVLDQVFNR